VANAGIIPMTPLRSEAEGMSFSLQSAVDRIID
jgi:hypothetical protein